MVKSLAWRVFYVSDLWAAQILNRSMTKSKSQRMKEYRARKKAMLGDEWLRRENQRVKSYFVPVSELPLRKREHKRELNRKHARTHRRKRKIDTNYIEGQNDREEAMLEQEPSTSQENEISSTTDIRTPLAIKMPFSSYQKSSRESRGRKRVSRALAKQYRTNETLRDQNEDLQRKLNSARKKLYRLKQKQLATQQPSTPKSKSESLLREAGIDLSDPSASKVRQKVLFAECIGNEIKAATQSNRKHVVMRIASGKIIKKYRMKYSLASLTGLNRRKMNGLQKTASICKRARNKVLNQRVENDIQIFLERDDNSRQLPGKADAVKVGKSKVQKRVLNDYMYNLHTKFLTESSYKVSHATFCRKKLANITHVNFSARSVCLCQKHQNFALKLRCLKNNKVTSITSPDKFMETFDSEYKLKAMLQNINCTTIKYQEWKRKKMSEGKERMRVVDIELPKGEFINVMISTYNEFAKHISRVIDQYKGLKQMKEKLPVNHVLVQMDFSENYTCQSLEEIQSAYWNATAITLHPTVIYKKATDGKLTHDSIVFVSEVLQHNAAMVQVIIQKVIKYIQESDKSIKGIHFWTDSPTSQYRNKTVFDIVSRLETEFGIKGSWHYLESGHGKGTCDGVGGTTKRNADNAIKQGKVIIQDEEDFYKWAIQTEGQIKYKKILPEEFDQRKEAVDTRNIELKPVKGTMKLHSVIGVSPMNILSRETVCGGFSENSPCEWERHSLLKPIKNANANDGESQKNGEIVSDTTNESTIQKENPEIDINVEDYVVIAYDMKYYIAKVTDIDKEDGELEVACMESCGKTIAEPVATGKSCRIFSVDAETLTFINTQF
ncbi:hypothetical protein MAR_023393 [Mya arenaria]|uniref:Uncharacterized protein n=1 Tax=Mya arenaria TaxID=6604 RepID=A0ABY7DVQ1_MYAAR|nr:hypothetical protein MAR_023393 [Mya arenaria]